MTEFRAKGINEYRRQSVNSATPIQLVVMLYDGALRACEAAAAAMEGGNLQRQHEQLLRAQKILTELSGSLDMDGGGEIAKNLFGLYAYCLNELVTANIDDDPAPVRRCIRVLSELRGAWAELNERPPQEARHAA